MGTKIAAQVASNLMAMVHGKVPASEQALIRQVEAEIRRIMKPFVALFNKAAIPLYKKHFTSAEIAASIAFYKTPEGQSIIRKMPLVMGESMQLGAAIARQLSARAVEATRARLRVKGYDL